MTWLRGRCLPYGEGITFWALGEIVKGRAGILESDPPDAARAKLDAVLPEGDERAWFRERLLPLLGVESTSAAEPGELFAAWSRFLQTIAEERPTFLVFEDLHWADDGLLSFLEHLADSTAAVPMLILGTARPDLIERRPAFASEAANASRIHLVALADTETTALANALLGDLAVPDDVRTSVARRAGGNPLFIGEVVRLLRDRAIHAAGSREGVLRARVADASLPIPSSIQAVIAARLDALSLATKSLLADAAVVGACSGQARLSRWETGRHTRWPTDCDSSRRGSSSMPASSRQSRARTSTRSRTRSLGTSPTRSCPGPRGPHVTSPRRGGSRPSRQVAPRTSRTCSPTTTRRRWSSRRRRARLSRLRTWGHPHAGS